jgi:L-fuconolactonase
VKIDAHQHFWDPARADYPWMTDEVAPIRRAFGPVDLAPVLAECGVDATVTVQARADVQETRELLAVAATSDFIAGVVGWVDLTDPGVGSVIRELLNGPGGGKLVGVRHQVHDEADAEWLLRADVQRGLGAVGDARLAYDLLVRARELPAALETLRRFPDTRFVIDHLAKPAVRDGDWEDWKAAMAPFGPQPNVYCKLSGLVTEADWSVWRPEQLAPYIGAALDWFGPERCMFGSDWPVCLLAASYRQVFDALLEALTGVDAAAHARVMGGTAVEFYRLQV